MQTSIAISTNQREELLDITRDIEKALIKTEIQNGIIHIYVQGATAAIMVQENWDESVQTDVIHFLQKIIPKGVWLHDRQDGNGDSHIKAGLVGPSETIPIINGKLGLSRWQNIFLCEFDGPRDKRTIILTFLK